MRVKICGITNERDALEAVDAGADALGFMFYKGSPRHIEAAVAAQIIAKLPPFVAKVGVFVNESAEAIRALADQCGLDTLQFHGNETPEFCLGFPRLKTIRAFRIRDQESLPGLNAFRTDAWLLDSFVPGKQGGTGAVFQWELAHQISRTGPAVILAGGLTPQNVAAAISVVRPYGVDVSSGVEAEVGRKDVAKVRAFIKEARRFSSSSL